MDKNKKLLLLSAIFVTIYIIFNLVIMFITNKYNLGDKLIIGSAIIGNIFFYYFSLNKKIDLSNYRFVIFIFSIMFFIYNIISGVLGFIVYSKTNKKEKRELPKIDIKMEYKWYIYVLVFLVSLFGIFFVSKKLTNNIELAILYLILISLNIYILRKEIKISVKHFITYFREYNSLVFSLYLKALVVLFIISYSIKTSTGILTSTNQSSIEEVLKVSPFYMILMTVIFAPILEELMFRGFIRKIIKNKWFFILFSGFLFGLLHVIDDFQSIGELLYIFVYSSLGCFLAYTYYKTNNICTNIYFHFLQNFISIVLILLLNILT